LFLHNNQLGDAAVTALAKAIKPTAENGTGALASLEALNLADNQIGDAGLTAFAEACAAGALGQLKVRSDPHS